MTADNDPQEPLDAALGDRLDRIASGAAPEPDLVDLVDRIGRRHRVRQRVTVGVASVVALATALGGYAIGHDGGAVVLSPGEAPSSTRAAGSADGSARGPSDTSTPSSGIPAAPSVGIPGSTSAVFARDTADGLALRVTKSPAVPYEIGYKGNGGVVPDECIVEGVLNIGVVTADDVAVLMTSITAVRTPLAEVSSSVTSTGTPIMYVSVTGASDALVRATFPDGATDSMRAHDGVAVLAATVPTGRLDDADAVKVTMTVDGATSNVPIRDSVARAIAEGRDSGPECTPRLPDPGQQPADVAAANQAVVDAFNRVYDFTTPAADRAAFVDEPSDLDVAMRRVLNGGFADAVKGAKWRLVDLVFTSPTTAVVTYDIEIPPGTGVASMATGRFGEARFVEGRWKATRDTICSALAMAGGSCGGEFDPIPSGAGPITTLPASAD